MYYDVNVKFINTKCKYILKHEQPITTFNDLYSFFNEPT